MCQVFFVSNPFRGDLSSARHPTGLIETGDTLRAA